MRLYHRTFHSKEILADGFADRTGYYLTFSEHTGVWFSNVPLDITEGAKGDTLLVIKIPIKEIRDYEWVEKGKPYREFLIPAAIVNRYGPPRIADED
jgi:hypothetical protein